MACPSCRDTWFLAVVAAVVVLGEPVLAVAAPSSPYTVLLKTRRPFLPKADVSKHLASGDPRGVLQFNALPTGDGHAAIQSAGIVLHAYLPSFAYLATVPPSITATALATLGVRAWFPLKANDRIDRLLRKNKAGTWAVPSKLERDVVVIRYPDQPESEATKAIIALGGTVLGTATPFGHVVARMTRKAIKRLAKESWVVWIDQIAPPLELHNDDSRASIGVDVVQAAPFNLTGAGVRVAVFDGNIDAHPDLAGRVTMSDLQLIDDHGTHVAGTLAGDGTLSGGLWRGMAPQALLYSWHFGGPILANMLTTITTEQTVILQNSWGVLTNNANNSCNFLGDYHWLSAGVDQMAHDHGVAFYFSQGNSRSFDCVPLTYGTTGVPASGKNVVAVGAVDKTLPGQMTAFSGWGPTDDGRLKPDVVAVGLGVDSTCLNATYCTKSGTSMSAPAVSGLAALLVEQYRQLNQGSDPPPALEKAILANTALDLAPPGPDFQHGYGKVDAVLATATVIDERFVNDNIDPGQHKRFYFKASSPPNCSFRVMAAYTDEEAAVNAAVTLVNDLDLKLVDPAGNVYLPSTLDPVNPTVLAAPAPNHRDNVEQVTVVNPMPGNWTARINGFNVPFPPQDFSLTWQAFEAVPGDGCALDAACPDLNDPCVTYVSLDPATCAAINFTCPPGDDKFTGGNGCGCGCIANCP